MNDLIVVVKINFETSVFAATVGRSRRSLTICSMLIDGKVRWVVG